jgi:hypothetical protein
VLGAAGRQRDLPGLVDGIGNRDPARRRAQIAVEIVDGEVRSSTGADCAMARGAGAAASIAAARIGESANLMTLY